MKIVVPLARTLLCGTAWTWVLRVSRRSSQDRTKYFTSLDQAPILHYCPSAKWSSRDLTALGKSNADALITTFQLPVHSTKTTDQALESLNRPERVTFGGVPHSVSIVTTLNAMCLLRPTRRAEFVHLKSAIFFSSDSNLKATHAPFALRHIYTPLVIIGSTKNIGYLGQTKHLFIVGNNRVIKSFLSAARRLEARIHALMEAHNTTLVVFMYVKTKYNMVNNSCNQQLRDTKN